MASSSDKKAKAPLDKATAAARASAALAVVMSNKGSAAAEAALAEAVSALKLARENDAAQPQMPAPAAALEKISSSAAAVDKTSSAPNNKATPSCADPELWLKKQKAKKYRRVRLSKETIDHILSYQIKPISKILDCYPVPPDQPLDYFDKLDAALDAVFDDFLQFQKRLREEYEKTGYAHGWETDDDEDAPAPRAPRPGRRRHRPGVMKHKGGTKKLN